MMVIMMMLMSCSDQPDLDDNLNKIVIGDGSTY